MDITTTKTNITSPIDKVEELMKLEKMKKEIDEKIAIYRKELLETTKELDILSLKTGSYVISRVKKTYATVSDFTTLKHSLDEANIPYDTVETFADHMKETFKQIAKSGKNMDGLTVSESEYIMIRIEE